jgi:competence protein ComEC
MRLPTLYPFLGFAGGILLFRASALQDRALLTPSIFLILAASFLFIGLAMLCKEWLLPAGLLAACVWLCLGFAAAGLEHDSIPPNLASTLIESGKLDSSIALRWRGRMREDPLQLPWGLRYEIDLDSVESAGGITPVQGGLRLTSYSDNSRPAVKLFARAGDDVEFFARPAPIRNFGNPGSEDERADLAFQGIDLQGTLRSNELLNVLAQPPPTIASRLARMRGNLLRSIDDLFAGQSDEAALARAMLLGDRSFVDRDRAVEFQETGVYHVLVLAGLHIGALTVFFLWLGRFLRIPLIPRVLLTIALLAAYAGIVEDRPPILRAALMAVTYLTAQLLYRRMELLNIAALSAIIILVARPSAISNSGFILSYVAVGIIGAVAVPWIGCTSRPFLRGIAHLQDVTRDVSHPPRVIQFRIELRAAIAWAIERLPRQSTRIVPQAITLPLRSALILWELMLLSTFLQLGMLPPMAYYFHRVTLIGPLMNVPALLLTGLIVPLGFLMLAASTLWRAVGRLLAVPLGLLLRVLDGSVRWVAQRHDSSYRIPGPPAWVTAAFVLCVIALTIAIRTQRRTLRWLALSGLLMAAVLVSTYPFAPRLNRANLEVTVVDVGQGDSLFVSFPQGHTMLVDAGGILGTFHAGGMRNGLDVGEDVVSPYLWSRGLKQIDVVALTHAHEDHLGGMTAVLENFHVNELWVGRDIAIPAYWHLLEVARRRGVAIKHLQQGDSFMLGGVSGRILWPENTIEGKAASNDDSLVMRLTDGNQSLLLTGDIERPSERKILAAEESLEATFLKVGHHGGKTSTTDPFLSVVHPKYAAISAGKDNPFGHPSEDVLERLEAAGVHVYRTDRDGAITTSTDGKTLTVTTFLHPASQASQLSSMR